MTTVRPSTGRGHSLSGVPPLTETEFLSQVIDLARVLGWRVAHFRPAHTARGWRTPVQGDGAGFPDLILVRHRVIAAELKAAKGHPTDDQRAWLAAFELAGTASFLWRPSDFDQIVEELSR